MPGMNVMWPAISITSWSYETRPATLVQDSRPCSRATRCFPTRPPIRATAPTWWRWCIEAPHVGRAEHQLEKLVRDLITEAARTGHVRTDVAPDELANYCLHAVSAASSLPSKVAVRRLVRVTLSGLRACVGTT